MSRLHKFFGLNEMARGKDPATLAMLDWAAQQTKPFTIRQAYDVYVANGGRSTSASDNIQSFTTQFQKMVAKQWLDGETPKKGRAPYWPPSDRRPMVNYGQRGQRGGGASNKGYFIWALDKPLRDPGATKLVDPDDDHNAGAAADRLEKALSRMGKGIAPDPKVGRQKAKDAIERWKKLKTINKISADIKATIPKGAQMDAMQIAWDMLSGDADGDGEQGAEDQVQATAPQDDDDDSVFGGFADDEDDIDFGDMSSEEEPEEEPEPAPPAPKAASPAKPAAPPPAPAAPEPEPEDDDIDFGGFEDDDEVEPSTAQQAGAASALKPEPAAVPTPAPAAAPPKKKEPDSKKQVNKFLKALTKK